MSRVESIGGRDDFSRRTPEQHAVEKAVVRIPRGQPFTQQVDPRLQDVAAPDAATCDQISRCGDRQRVSVRRTLHRDSRGAVADQGDLFFDRSVRSDRKSFQQLGRLGRTQFQVAQRRPRQNGCQQASPDRLCGIAAVDDQSTTEMQPILNRRDLIRRQVFRRQVVPKDHRNGGQVQHGFGERQQAFVLGNDQAIIVFDRGIDLAQRPQPIGDLQTCEPFGTFRQDDEEIFLGCQQFERLVVTRERSGLSGQLQS